MNSKLNHVLLIAAAVSVGNVSAKDTAKTYSFAKEPVFFKGSGSCEGIELADLNQDGIRDIISGVPRGNIHVYYGKKSKTGVSYGEKKDSKKCRHKKEH